EVAAESRKLVDGDPKAKELRDRAENLLDANELKFFERNLAEIIAYSSREGYQDRRADLFAKVERFLQGPVPGENGIMEFPLRGQYIDEDLKDFDNWYQRTFHTTEKPGEMYNRPWHTFDSVDYLTAEQRAQ